MAEVTVTSLCLWFCVCVCVHLSGTLSRVRLCCDFLSRCVKIDVASCQFGIIDMIQLREVTATLCIFQGPQRLHFCRGLLAFESFYRVVKACCDVGMICLKCTKKWLGLFPEPNFQHCPFQMNYLFSIPYGYCFLVCKIYFKMPLLKWLRWNQDQHIIGWPQWWPFESDQLGAIFIMLPLCKWTGLKYTEAWNTYRERVCVSSCVGLQQHIF